MGRNSETSGRRVTQSLEGSIDLGFGDAFFGHADVPEHVETAERIQLEWASTGHPQHTRETDLEFLDRMTSELAPLLGSSVELVPQDEEVQWRDHRCGLVLDLGTGPALYRRRFPGDVPSLKPEENADPEWLGTFEMQRIAWEALECVESLRTGRGGIRTAIELGSLLERLRLEKYRGRAVDGLILNQARKAGGAATTRTSVEEKQRIIEARDALMKTDGRPKMSAAKIIAARLFAGQFPGIDRKVEYDPKYIANLRAAR